MVQTTTPFVLMAFGNIQRWWQWRRAKRRAVEGGCRGGYRGRLSGGSQLPHSGCDSLSGFIPWLRCQGSPNEDQMNHCVKASLPGENAEVQGAAAGTELLSGSHPGPEAHQL